MTSEDETFRRLKREPEFWKVREAAKKAQMKALLQVLEEMGWTKKEFLEAEEVGEFRAREKEQQRYQRALLKSSQAKQL